MCEMAGQGCGEPQNPDAKVFIDSVSFVGGESLPADVREQVFATVKFGDVSPGPFSEDWLRSLEQLGPRDALQMAGYFQAFVEAKGQILASVATLQHVAVTVRIDEGPRYRLGSIQFRPVADSEPLVFSPAELRQQFQLADASIFDVSKIRQGLDSLSRLYGSLGYIDFTAEPQEIIDAATGIVSIVLVLNLQQQYRIGKVEVWGPNPVAEKTLQAQWKSGDVFNVRRLNDFFEDNTALLPADASRDDLRLGRHGREGTVDLRFDFRACPCTQR